MLDVVVCMCSSQSEESVQLVNEVDRGKQVMVTYEQSMARKDQIINSLTRALAKQVRESVCECGCVSVSVCVSV